MEYKFENKILEVAMGGLNVNSPIGNKIYKVKLHEGKYQGGGVAILGYLSDGEPFATLTVNMPEHQHLLNKDEVFIKNWSENEAFARSALRSGYFLNTGKSVRTGFVEAPIWLLIREGDF